jgi:hypothetical protein
MKTLHTLTAVASILLAVSGPSLAAPRTQVHRPADVYSYDNNDNAFWPAPYGSEGSVGSAYSLRGRNGDTFAPGPNVPYRSDANSATGGW